MPSSPDLSPLPRALHRSRNRAGAPPERSWTPVGTVDSGVLATVDDAGLVHLQGAEWSLDWWIGAEDRWHHPSVEVAVRRSTRGAAPVPETAMRVPGGDVVHRAYGVQARAGSWSGPAVVVEVENLTAVPVALALVLRPVLPDGPGRLDAVRVDAEVAEVDGVPAVLLDRTPRDVVGGRSGEVVDALADGGMGTPPEGPSAFTERDGAAEVALVVPLAHTATVRVLLPVSGSGRRDAPAPAAPWEAPAADAVVTGWGAHAAAGLRAVAPEPGWDDAVAWADRVLRLAAPDAVGELLDRARPAPAGPPAAVRAAVIAEALARGGADGAADPVADALAAQLRRGGEVRLGDRSDGGVALLWAAAAVLAGRAGRDRAEALLVPVAAVVDRLARRARAGDLPEDPDAAARAARLLVPGLLAVGQPEVAEDALRAADLLVPGDGAAGPGAPEPSTTLEVALAARRAVRSRLPGAVGAVRDLWAERTTEGRADVVDGEGRPSGASGFDVAELAARTLALVDLLVADGPRGPELLPVWPTAWNGAAVEVHGVRTAWGTVGAALRWHGGRPALLWEVDPAPGLDPETSAPLVRAPGPDPDWEAAGWAGEALLSAVEGAPQADGGKGASPAPPGEGHSFT